MDILGLIPARGGSKSIPRKNIALVAGRPLLAYTSDAALQSRRLTRVIASTDDEEIATVARHYGVEVPFLRPPELSMDETPMLGVIQHALRFLERKEGYRPEGVVLLQPTSPLRSPQHIDEAVDIFLESGADTVVSVIGVPHNFNPVSLMRIANGKLRPFVDGPMILRRQDKPQLYARNGPAVLVIRSVLLRGQGTIYGDDCRPYVMRPEDSLDVDTPLDLELAEFLLSRRKLGAQ